MTQTISCRKTAILMAEVITKVDGEDRGKLEQEKGKRIRARVFRTIPWICGLILVLLLTGPFAFLHDDPVSPKELVNYAPKNEWLAALFMIALYAFKSMVFVIPMPLLYISSGLIFKPARAFLVNVLGMITTATLPYWIGRYSGGGVMEKILKKFPKMQVLDNLKRGNEWFFSFIVRVIGFLPCDAVSMFMGACRVDFKKYITGTAAGMLPGLISITMVGITITDPHSPEFLFSCILSVILSIASFVVYWVYTRLRNSRASAASSSDPAEYEKSDSGPDHQESSRTGKEP